MGVNSLLSLKSEDNSHTLSITSAAPDTVLPPCLPSDWSSCGDLNFTLQLWSKAETDVMQQENIISKFSLLQWKAWKNEEVSEIVLCQSK